MRKQRLTHCRICKLESVVPILDECEHNRETDRWHISLVCTSCHEHRKVDVAHEVAESFDRALDGQTRLLSYSIRRWAHDNMRDDVRRFTAALEADAIWPEDFVA